MSNSKRHHFLSQFYLKGFAIDNEEGLYGVNLKDKSVIGPVHPKNFAVERYFNNIESDVLPPDALEAQLAIFESRAPSAIENITKTAEFAGENRTVILNLLTLFAIRNPQRRKSWDYTATVMAAHLLEFTGSIIENAPIGSSIDNMIVTEELKNAFAQKFRVEVLLPREHHIKTEFEIFNKVLPGMFARKWVLVKASETSSFITSDFPVSLNWCGEEEPWHSPGFDSMKTQIVFPLTKKFALLGKFEGEEGVVEADDKLVAMINSITLGSAKNWIYASTLDFLFMNLQDNTIACGANALWSLLSQMDEFACK